MVGMEETSSKLTLSIPKAKDANICIEMPMHFKQGANMSFYFGGTSNLQTIQDTKTPFLPVKLRPTEPNAKPIFADRAKTQSFLLKINKSNNNTINGTIKMISSEKFVCEGMIDYQYFASNNYMKSNNNTMDIKLREYLKAKKQNDLEIIPEVFSRVDLPLKYEFKQRPQYNESITSSSELKQVSRHFFTYANFRSDSPIPENTNRIPKTRGIPKEVEEKVMSLLKDKFSQRPIWMRPKLFEFFTPEEGRVAMKFLPYICYIFVNGPWRGMWVRLGYDPRKTPEAAPYQLVEIRGTRRLVNDSVTPILLVKKKSHRRLQYRSRLNAIFQGNDSEDKVAMHLKKKKTHNRSRATLKARNGDDDTIKSSHTIYGVPLREGFFYIQLCDLIEQNKQIQLFVEPFHARLRKTASVWGGWYPMCMFQPIREMLKLHIVKTVGRPQDEIIYRQNQIERAARHAMEEFEIRDDIDSEEEKDKIQKGDDENSIEEDDEDEDDDEQIEKDIQNNEKDDDESDDDDEIIHENKKIIEEFII